MPVAADSQSPETEQVNLLLMGGRVTRGYRTAVFDHASRLGLSVNEYVLLAAAEKLHAAGSSFPGIFNAGDFANLSRTDHEG